MSTEIRVPQLPESVADATLVAWHKQPGDAIRRDENLADLETDKVVLEVPAPANGIVRELRVASGTVVTSGQVLAVIEEGAAAAAKTAPAAAAKCGPGRERHRAGACAPAPAEEGRDAGKLSPSVRRLVEENQLDPDAIPASGRDGRLTKSDIVGFLGKKPRRGAGGTCGALRPRGRRPARRGRRCPHRAARADDAPARAHRPAPDRGTVHPGAADHLQRGGPDGRRRSCARATRTASRRSTA